MIYVLTEDAGSGYRWCKYLLNNVYYKEYQNKINIMSYNGISKLADTLNTYESMIKDEDVIIVIYDDIMENPLVNKSLKLADDAIRKMQNIRMGSNLFFIKTLGFDLSILNLIHIEYLCDFTYYNTMIFPIREMFMNGSKSGEITRYTKSMPQYHELYEWAKQQKIKKKYGYFINMSDEELLKHCTIESIAKKMLATAFDSKNSIDVPVFSAKDQMAMNCWKDKCCIRKDQKCASPFMDAEKMISKEGSFLIQYMVINSPYIKLIKKIDDVLEIDRDERVVDILECIKDVYKE